jgi:hypothetical protein
MKNDILVPVHLLLNNDYGLSEELKEREQPCEKWEPKIPSEEYMIAVIRGEITFINGDFIDEEPFK